MGADKLPADMEGRLEKLAAMTTVDPTPLDAYGRCSATFGDLRALLKAYQEQRRALEPLRRPHWTDDDAIDDLDEDAVIDLTVTVGEFQRIRAALNQKGDEL